MRGTLKSNPHITHTFAIASPRHEGVAIQLDHLGWLRRCAPRKMDERVGKCLGRVGAMRLALPPVCVELRRRSIFLFVKPTVADEDAERRRPRNVESRESVQKTATHKVRPKKAPAGPENCGGKGEI